MDIADLAGEACPRGGQVPTLMYLYSKAPLCMVEVKPKAN